MALHIWEGKKGEQGGAEGHTRAVESEGGEGDVLTEPQGGAISEEGTLAASWTCKTRP